MEHQIKITIYKVNQSFSRLPRIFWAHKYQHFSESVWLCRPQDGLEGPLSKSGPVENRMMWACASGIYVCKLSYHTHLYCRNGGHSINELVFLINYSIVIVVSFTILASCGGNLGLIILTHTWFILKSSHICTAAQSHDTWRYGTFNRLLWCGTCWCISLSLRSCVACLFCCYLIHSLNLK